MGFTRGNMSGPGKAKTVWITRTDTGAASSAGAVKLAGFMPLVAPLLKLSAVSTPSATPDEGSVLAFTSPNGVLAFRALSDRRTWPVYAVGDATAKAARDAGFDSVKSAGGAVDDLVALIVKASPTFVTYLSGVHVAGDLIGRLEAANIPCVRTIIYGSEAVCVLDNAVEMALGCGDVLSVMLYSPKAAHILCRLLPPGYGPQVHCVSISPKVDAVLDISEHKFASRQIAEAPNEPAMTALLEAVTLKA